MNPYTALMTAARTRCQTLGAALPSLSPNDATIQAIDIPALQALGIRIIPWTTNDPATMRTLIAFGVDGLITDRPDLLQQIPNLPAGFDVQGHRGARGLRPENTLPAFEAGLDHLVTTLETDTGVTRDLHSILWHDQFLNPESCRRLDQQPYALTDAWYHRDHTLAEIQSTFVSDKLHPRFPDQRNDLTLSPVSAAFAQQEAKPSPYSPVATAELFRFTRFYAGYYRTGPGHTHPHAEARALNATTVRFNLETKILPYPDGGRTPPLNTADPTTNHTVGPEIFVTTLCNTINQASMQTRCTIQSFDFRTLERVQEQYPQIPTIYLTE